jgi:type 1 fimbria pilin
MGDLEALCERPTVEIGDRVWFDTNQNGIQDADEPGIAGVTVRLYDTSGNLLAETLTGTDGSYRFGFNEGVRAGSDYVIRLDNPDDYASGGPLAGLQLTARSVNTSQDALANEVDSSARLTTAGLFSRSYPTMMVGALTAGINNYTFDAGFVVPPPPPPTGSITGTVFTDLAETGLFTGSEPVHVGLQIELKDSDGAPVVDSTGAIVPVFMTGSDGNYQFTNLPVGTYTVRFVSQTPDGMRLLVAVHTVVVSFSMLHHVAVDFPLRPDSPSLPLAEPPIPTQVPAGSGPLDLVSFWLLFVVAAGVVLQYAGHNHIIFRKAKQT